jgi:hypothetical protein
MRIVSWTIFAALCIAPVASAQSAPQRIPVNGGSEPASIANAPDPAVGAVVSAVMPRVAAWGPVKGVPFSATETTVREQTLADGTVIKNTVEVQLSRDSAGRMRAESTLKPKFSAAPQGHIVTIWNPIDGTAITWVTENQSANFASVTHLPELQLNGLMGALASAPPPGALSRSLHAATPLVALSSAATRDTANIHTEALPADSIAGLEVTGTRTTQVVAAGSIDNDRDFTVTSETWISPELKTTMRQLTSDPRTGTVTTELSNIDRSEPDPALFKPPAGYKLTDFRDSNASDPGAKR